MNSLPEACLVAALLLGASAGAASPTIELKDGSRIVGEIQSLTDGVYTVVTPNLGSVHVAQSAIERIVYSGDAAAAAPTAPAMARNDALASDMLQLQTRIAQDPSAMQSIMSLQSDPQIQAALNDPAIMKAIQEGDFLSLLGNPKIQALENDERLKQVVQQQAH